jgi:hypothetical protein
MQWSLCNPEPGNPDLRLKRTILDQVQPYLPPPPFPPPVPPPLPGSSGGGGGGATWDHPYYETVGVVKRRGTASLCLVPQQQWHMSRYVVLCFLFRHYSGRIATKHPLAHTQDYYMNVTCYMQKCKFVVLTPFLLTPNFYCAEFPTEIIIAVHYY